MKKLTAALAFMVLFLGMTGGAMAITIMDDATGGDCTQIGIWDAGTKTCTLMMDLNNLYPGIEIGSDGITLDGNGHVISGVGASIGVQIYGRRYVVVKNLDITQFEYGIYIVRSSDNRISNNTVTNNDQSGIVLAIGNNNIIERNNSMYHRAFGIFVVAARGNTFTDNILYGCQWGISFGNSHNNTLLRNVVNSTYGISLGNSNNNTVAENTISGAVGIDLASYSTSNKFFNNSIATTYRAISIWYFANSNVFYNNNVIQGGWGWFPVICGTEAGMNTFSLEAPGGGNYWGNYDSPEEGCNDANNDGFCDAAFVTCGGTDYLPWTRQDGWRIVPATIDVKPDTLNKKSNAGKNTVTVYIEIPDYDVTHIETTSVKLSTSNGSVAVQPSPTEIADYDSDGVPDLMVKFDRQSVIAIADIGKEVEVEVSGKVGGKMFKGNDKIKVLK